ncbi:MAG: DNA-3-methyladenine glycosylase [Chitinophagales bacterium]
MRLNKKYFQHEDVVFLAKDLLGKLLVTEMDGIQTGGIITETEAYSETEKGCHAYNKRKTERTKIMFEAGGLSYVYFCYGMHHLFNIVTGKKDTAQAILIRAIHPTIGIETILQRRGKTKVDKNLCNGPGKVCQALGITKEHYGLQLTKEKIWLSTSSLKVKEDQIQITPRIGIDYAEEHKNLPWRFLLNI